MSSLNVAHGQTPPLVPAAARERPVLSRPTLVEARRAIDFRVFQRVAGPGNARVLRQQQARADRSSRCLCGLLLAFVQVCPYVTAVFTTPRSRGLARSICTFFVVLVLL
jgi:hypothetical protein